MCCLYCCACVRASCFLAVRRLPPHRTAFHAFRALQQRRALNDDVGDDFSE